MPESHKSDEERAREILAAFNRLERRNQARVRMVNFIWVITLLLVVALIAVVWSNLSRFKLLYQLLTRPDSLIGR